eukprot:CAMPEP_0185511184 /NCGR_PEP_ID=MMETSP1366-20130426/51065_2 /TAXON_ID=38817 /ORGANISM="Gephyrocapsa oceanica, Strain RCC1303" /LENGTH=84 /DNA_ID=CAMNT_0028121737 /DNA_START=9 /DNA_END=259 /DNA_ORIENTATION=-
MSQLIHQKRKEKASHGVRPGGHQKVRREGSTHLESQRGRDCRRPALHVVEPAVGDVQQVARLQKAVHPRQRQSVVAGGAAATGG